MKSIILSISLALMACVSANAQYHLRLKFEYFDKDGNVRPAIEGSEMVYQDYYIINGKVKSVCDQGFIILSDCNKDKYKKVMYSNGNKLSDSDIKPSKSKEIESTKRLKTNEQVMGYECQGIMHTFKDGSVMTSFYSDQVKVDLSQYDVEGNEEFKFLKEKGGALDLKYSLESKGGKKFVATTVLIEKIEYIPEDYDLKKFIGNYLESNRDRYEVLLSEYKDKYDFAEAPVDFKAQGEMKQGELNFPVEVQVKNPNKMLMRMNFGVAKFIIGSNGKITWQYNPVNQQVEVADNSKDDLDYLGQFIPNLRENWDDYTVNSFMELDSSYRVVLFKEGAPGSNVYYYNKETLLIETKFDAVSSSKYFDYRTFNGYTAPTRYIQQYHNSTKPAFNITFTNMEFNVELSDEAFDIPEDLRDKAGDKSQKLMDENKNAIDYFNEAEALANNDNYKEAVPLYKQAIQLNTNIAIYHNQLGLALLETEDYYGAVAEFSRALEINPNLAVAKNNLGYAKMHFGDFKAAITDIEAAIDLDDENPNFYSNRANCYLSLSQYDSALNDYKMAIKLDSTTQFGYYNVAMCYYNLGIYDSAVINYDLSESRKLHLSGDLFNYRGISKYNLEDYNGAAEDFLKATKSEEPLLNYFGNLGQTYSELGESKKAISAYKDAIKMDSTYAEGHNLIGLEYYNQELYNEAINSFNAAIDINNTEAVYYDNRARAKSEKMDYVGAIEDLSHSINLYPDDASIYYLRGLTKQHINEKFDACLDFKKASEMGLDEASETMNDYCLSGG